MNDKMEGGVGVITNYEKHFNNDNNLFKGTIIFQ